MKNERNDTENLLVMKHLTSLCIGLLSLFLLSCSASNNEPSKKPNILFILADDLGYEKVGCFGGLNTSTPNLDELSTHSTIFTRTYGSPVCTPSRMSIYTGSYVPRHKYTTVLPVHVGTKEAVDFETKFTTYAKLLRDEGYETSVTGKWQLAALEYHPDHCKTAGFDSWCVWQIWHDDQKTTRYWNPTLNKDGQVMEISENDFGPDLLTKYVIERMKTAQKDNKPFLIHHNMMLPHVPLIQTPDDIKEEKSAELDNMISYLDKQVGILLDSLEQLGLAENTYVFFVGDNGTYSEEPRMTKKGQVVGGKFHMNDAGSHVPFIAYAPGRVPENKEADDLIDFVDFFPTICELAGVEIPENVCPDGMSFIEPLTGEGSGSRKWVTGGINDDFFVFDGNWRMNKKDSTLVDCRNLPEELTIKDLTDDTKIIRDSLLTIIDKLKDLN